LIRRESKGHFLVLTLRQRHILFESPLAMLCDNVSLARIREPFSPKERLRHNHTVQRHLSVLCARAFEYDLELGNSRKDGGSFIGGFPLGLLLHFTAPHLIAHQPSRF
jgi:hypothetical protein